MTADIMGLNLLKTKENGLFCDKTVHFLYVNLLNNRYDKLYKSDKNMYCYKKTEEYPIILLTNPIISSNVMV